MPASTFTPPLPLIGNPNVIASERLKARIPLFVMPDELLILPEVPPLPSCNVPAGNLPGVLLLAELIEGPLIQVGPV